ncbi:MAG: sulfite exporter TauE/SafE family protein [Hyphomicrobiales bacterium]
MTELTLGHVAALCGAAFFAGGMDAIAGGGGLITVPALLAAGLPPHAAIATNKGQSTFGSFAAVTRYGHAGLIDRTTAWFAFPLAVAGSALGALVALRVPADVLRPIVLALLLGAGVVVTISRPRAEDGEERPARRNAALGIGTAALLIGAYDGFFGPGTGTFLIAFYVGWVGLSMRRATADAKVVNFAANAAAMAVFASRGAILWRVALPMAAAQLLGGFLGAHVAVRRGERLIRGVVLFVVVALVLKVARDVYLGQQP